MYIKSKKRLGQNFLIDKNIQNKLIASYSLKGTDCVLELGSGYGELTKLIAASVTSVYAIEIDPGLCEILRVNTEGFPNVKIINQDILKFDLRRYVKGLKTKLKVVGNIPYYITTPIIERLIKYRDKIETAFITVQKEFAKRVIAKPGSKEYGSFSCFVQYYCIPKEIFLIKRRSFRPSPKVDSCLLELIMREAPAVKTEDERLFFKVIRGSFNKRRKTLRNSLAGIVALHKLGVFFKTYGIDSDIRPERLTLQDFANLANLQKNIKKG